MSVVEKARAILTASKQANPMTKQLYYDYKKDISYFDPKSKWKTQFCSYQQM